jgi:hypothetical protein
VLLQKIKIYLWFIYTLLFRRGHLYQFKYIPRGTGDEYCDIIAYKGIITAIGVYNRCYNKRYKVTEIRLLKNKGKFSVFTNSLIRIEN